MRKLLLIPVLVLGLAACDTFGTLSEPKSEEQIVFDNLADACHAYASALRIAAAANASGKLSTDDVMTVDTAREIINPVCDGPAPVGPLALNIALNTIQTSLYDLILLSQTVEE